MKPIYRYQKPIIWQKIICRESKKNGQKNEKSQSHHYMQPFFVQISLACRAFLFFRFLDLAWRHLCHLFYQALVRFRISVQSPASPGSDKIEPMKELIDWFSEQGTDTSERSGDVGYAYMLAGVYGICSLASSWIIAPLMYWNMTDGHNFRTQAICLNSRNLIGC